MGQRIRKWLELMYRRCIGQDIEQEGGINSKKCHLSDDDT